MATKNNRKNDETQEQLQILAETIGSVSTNSSEEEILKFVNVNLNISKFKTTAISLGTPDKSVIRYLVDNFYQIQSLRKISENRKMYVENGIDGEGYDNIPLLIFNDIKNIEGKIKKIIDVVTDHIPICWYMKQIKGVGPMLSATLYAYLDIEKARSAGSFWTYCGLNDNNTPWLGKEKSANYSKQIMEQIASQCEAEINFIKGYFSQDEIDKIMKNIINKSKKENPDILIDEFTVQDYITARRPDVYSEFARKCPEACEDGVSRIKLDWAFIYNYDKNFVTQEVINRLAIHNKVNRNPNQIYMGAYNQHMTGTGAKKQYLVKADLDKFMAKPPYNQFLKVTMFKLEDCIMKQSNKPDSRYGALYKDRLAYEMHKNENGDYAAQAREILATKNITDKATKESYENGKLTMSHIYRRSLRWMAKLMLSHMYEAWYIIEHGELPPIPYILLYAKVNGENMVAHTDYIKPEIPYEKVLKHFNLPIPEGLDTYPKLSEMNQK